MENIPGNMKNDSVAACPLSSAMELYLGRINKQLKIKINIMDHHMQPKRVQEISTKILERTCV